MNDTNGLKLNWTELPFAKTSATVTKDKENVGQKGAEATTMAAASKTSLKKCIDIRVVSIPSCSQPGSFLGRREHWERGCLVQFIKSRRIFLKWNSKGLFLSWEKKNRCLDLTFYTKREIRKFHVVVVQQRQRNAQKAWRTCKVVVLLIQTYWFFAVVVAVAVVVA